jgi:hypothetical protein
LDSSATSVGAVSTWINCHIERSRIIRRTYNAQKCKQEMMKFAAPSAHPHILFMYLIPYHQPIRLMELELVTIWAKTEVLHFNVHTNCRQQYPLTRANYAYHEKLQVKPH